MRWQWLQRLMLVALAVTPGSTAGLLPAQAAPGWPTAAIPIVRDTVRPGSGDLADGLPPWTPMKPAVARTLAGITFINIAATGINILARDIVSPSPSTWWQNLQGGWEWDPNDIRVNHVEHPWAGAAYFNAGRGNGLSFWGSAPMALTGSMMWELFGEAKPPSINDVLTTSLGGVALGEPLHLLSLIVLDDESSGLDRLWREVAVFITNPGLGLSRVSRGQSWARRQNPPGRRPDYLRGGIAAGARRVGWADGGEAFRTPFLSLILDYGDPFAAETGGPFSFFNGGMELMSSSPDGLSALNTRGLLARFGSADRATVHVGGIFMDLDYRRDGAVELAVQSFGVGLLSRIPLSGGFRLATDLSAEAVPILAVGDRYGKALTGRWYDYGAGAGARVLAELKHRGHPVVSISGRAYWGPTIDGASETKVVQLAGIAARLPAVWSLSLGASYQLYLQRSTYDTRSAETERRSSVSLFLATGRQGKI